MDGLTSDDQRFIPKKICRLNGAHGTYGEPLELQTLFRPLCYLPRCGMKSIRFSVKSFGSTTFTITFFFNKVWQNVPHFFMSASLRRQAEDNCTESDGDGCGEAILVTTPPPIFSNFYLKLLANKFLNVAHTNF